MYEIIQAPQGAKYISDVYKEDLPDNVYLDKTLCGCGATTFVLTNDVDYIVTIPFKSLGDNKLIQSIDNPQYPHELFVYHSGIEQVKIELTRYLERRGNLPKKIMVTYDSLPSLSSHIEFKDYKLFIDESHKVLEYAGNFKPQVIYNMLSLIPRFKSFIAVTATPTREDFIPVEFQQYPKVKIEWSQATPVTFKHSRLYQNQIRTVFLAESLKHLRGEEEGNLYIFINSLSTIKTIIKDLISFGYGVNDIKVICADTDVNKKSLKMLGKDWKPKAVIEKDDNKFYKINFITSTAFEGQDFLDPIGKTFILSDGKLEHTKLDISTQISQIVGRLRVSKFKDTVYMYWTMSHIEEYQDLDTYETHVRNEAYEFSKMTEEFQVVSIKMKEAAFEMAKKTLYLIEDEENFNIILNPNAVNHLLNNYIGTTLQYYVNTEESVKDTEDHVNFTLFDVFSGSVESNNVVPELSPQDKKKLGRKINFGKGSKTYLNALRDIQYTSKDSRENQILLGVIHSYEEDPNFNILMQYIEVFGIQKLMDLEEGSIRESRLDKELTEYYQRNHANSVLKSSFSKGDHKTNRDWKDSIDCLYKRHRFNFKSKTSDLDYVFVTKKSKISSSNSTLILRKK